MLFSISIESKNKMKQMTNIFNISLKRKVNISIFFNKTDKLFCHKIAWHKGSNLE